MTQEQRQRLRELETLDDDGIDLSDNEYAELRTLLNMENDEHEAACSMRWTPPHLFLRS